jgi:hypothetical protein
VFYTYILTIAIHNVTTEDNGILSIDNQSNLHEVLEIMLQCEDCNTTTDGWTIVYSHLMCQKIQQLRLNSLRMEPTNAETHHSIS